MTMPRIKIIPSWEVGGRWAPFFICESFDMTIRTAVFIDGANFRRNLRSFLFSSTSPDDGRTNRLEERHFDWKQFFRGVLEKFDLSAGWEHQLIRIHWYNAASISSWITSEWTRLRLAQGVVDRNPAIKGLTSDRVIELAHGWYRRERDFFERLREDVFERIQRRTDFLEFRYVGQDQVHPLQEHRIQQAEDGTLSYLGKQVGEKGVDEPVSI